MSIRSMRQVRKGVGAAIVLLAVCGCDSSRYGESVRSEEFRRSTVASDASGPASPNDQGNVASSSGNAEPMNALDATVLALAQLDRDAAALHERAEQAGQTLSEQPLTITDDASLALRDLESIPAEPGAAKLTEQLTDAFGPAGGRPSRFLSGSAQHVFEACEDEPALAPTVISFLLNELTTHQDPDLAMYAGRLAGRIAAATGNQLGLRRAVVKACFDRQMPLRQSAAYLAALDAAHDVNGLAWVANIHSDEFVGRTAVHMLAQQRGMTEPVLLQMRERHQGLVSAQSRLWDGMAAIAAHQRSLAEQTNGMISARSALADARQSVERSTGALNASKKDFETEIRNSQEQLRIMEQRLADLTAELQKAVAEAQHYKQQLEQPNTGS